jgi:iron only hydrogenase large subunit-like protein
MKNKSIVKVTDPRSQWFGRTGKVHQAVNQNRLLVDIDNERISFMSKQLEQVRNVYTPKVQIVDDKLVKIAVAMEKRYNQLVEEIAELRSIDTDMTRVVANSKSEELEVIKNWLNGKY